MGWRSRDKKAKDIQHDSMESHLRQAKRRHAARIRLQFPNWEDVVEDATAEVRDYEGEVNLPIGSFDVQFDEHGLDEGYFLVIPEHLVELHREALIDRIRKRTRETFDVKIERSA